MPVKEMAKRVIDELPEGATLRDIIYALYVREQFERGEREIRDGKGINHEQVKREFSSWSA